MFSRNSEKTEIKPGNQCLFMMFTGFNFLLFLSALGILGCAITIWVVIKGSNTFAVVFFICSLFLLMLTTCAFRLRESIHLLFCYLIIQAIMFTFLLIFTLVLRFNTTYIANWAETAY